MLALRSEETRVGTTVAQRNTEALSAAVRHIGTQFTRRLEQSQRQQIRAYSHLCTRCVCALDQRSNVLDHTIGAGVLHQHTTDFVVNGGVCASKRYCERQLSKRVMHTKHGADFDLNAQRLGTCLHHSQGLRVNITVHQEHVALLTVRYITPSKCHGLCGSCSLIQ